MIKKSYVPFYQNVLFFCFSSLLFLPCQKTLVFRFFSINSQVIRWPRIFQYYFRIYWKKSQYKSFTTRKQQLLGENKKKDFGRQEIAIRTNNVSKKFLWPMGATEKNRKLQKYFSQKQGLNFFRIRLHYLKNRIEPPLLWYTSTLCYQQWCIA